MPPPISFQELIFFFGETEQKLSALMVSIITHSNTVLSYSWLALGLTLSLNMSFPMIFNPKTIATTTIRTLAMCQALCCGKYYVCIIFLNLLKNPIRQKTFYSRGNRGLGRLKQLVQGNCLRDKEVKTSTLNHFSTQPLRSTGSNSRGLELVHTYKSLSACTC